VVAERFFDEAGGMQTCDPRLPSGSRHQSGLGTGACANVSRRLFNFELQAAATDNGINISLTEQARLSTRARF